MSLTLHVGNGTSEQNENLQRSSAAQVVDHEDGMGMGTLELDRGCSAFQDGE